MRLPPARYFFPCKLMTTETNDATDFATREYAAQQDRLDPLRHFRDEFHIPQTSEGQDEVYLVGNSLGLQPKRAAAFVFEALDRWRTMGVRGHCEGPHPWVPYHEFLTEPMARIVGGFCDEVVVMNSLTTNLHLMLATFYRPTTQRHKILIEAGAFPSDRYAVESQIRWHGFNPQEALVACAPRSGELLLCEDDVCERIEHQAGEIAVVLLPGVQYYTGQSFDIEHITRAAHRHGIVVGFDLAHSAGNVELRLHDWDVDFAVWCTYKYLNSGPGAVAGCFIHSRHIRDPKLPRLAGWWGHDKASRFEMPSRFTPIPTAEGWQVSNPPILSLAAVRAALEVFDEAGGMQRLRQKSLQLNDYLLQLLDRHFAKQITVITPRDPHRRGCQLSLSTVGPPGSLRLHEALANRGVATDYRQPDVLRAAPTPLYNSFVDVFEFVERLRDVWKGTS